MLFLFIAYFAIGVSSYEHAYIYGNTSDLGYYYVDIWVGTPAIKQTVIIDTGSRLTAFPCMDCPDCGKHLDSYFDYKQSDSSRIVKCDEGINCASCVDGACGYSVSYAEGSSLSGILIEDYVVFGDDFYNNHRVKVKFGCHRRETNLFRTQLADGIMGLGNTGTIPTIVELLYKDHDINTDLFSICFGSNSGFMTIGGYNQSFHFNEISWISLQGGMFYSIQGYELRVADEKTDITKGDFGSFSASGSIVDSGTTFTYLTTKIYLSLFRHIKSFCEISGNCNGERKRVNGEANSCYQYNHDDYPDIQDFFNTFPNVSFLFDDSYIYWMPKSYLFAWNESPSTFCVGVYSNGGAGNVLGGNFMRGNDVIFDKQNKKVGFAAADCILGGDSYRSSLNESIHNQTNKNENNFTHTNTEANQGFNLMLIIIMCLALIGAGIIAVWCIRKKKHNSLIYQDRQIIDSK